LMILGLSSGLLSFVLTPCLLQLLVIYIATLAGLSATKGGQKPQALQPTVARRLMVIAVAFVSAFTALFTLSGAVVGYAGKQVQMFISVWSSTISVAAGILVIVLGIWIGIRSRAPILCRFVDIPDGVRKVDSSGIFSSAIMAVGFSLGCLTCFGGAIIATLLVYVGSLGSASVGAAVMFSFSLGIVVPFLLAALFLSRTIPLIHRLSLYAPYLGFFSMIVIVAFGLVLVTDNFHVLSNFIYPFLGLR